MRIKLFSDMINKELSFLLPRALMMDGFIYLVTLPFYGFGLEIPSGLILGTAAMLINFILLGRATERAVEKGAGAKGYMMLWYVLRMGVVGFVFVLALKIHWINPIAAVLPLFYPKAAYTIHEIYSNRRGGKS